MDLTPISSLPTPKRPIIRVNGKVLTEQPLEKEEVITFKHEKMYSSSFLMLSSIGLAQKLFEEISLFKQNEDSIPVNGWFEKEPYVPIQTTPDFFKHLIPESMYQWNLTSISSQTETFKELSIYFQELYQRFSVLFQNLAHSGPVLVVVWISMTLLVLNQFVKEKTTQEKEEIFKKMSKQKAD